MISNNALYVYTACVTIFSTGGKSRPVLNFMESHGLTLAAHSYARLVLAIPTLNKAILFPERFSISSSVSLSRDVPMVAIWLPPRLRSLSLVRASIPWERSMREGENERRREEEGEED